MLHISPPMAAAAYELLRATQPYRGWKLPAVDEVEFFISNSRKVFATHQQINGKHRITVSARNIGSLDMLTKAMAHEMIHVHEMNLRACRADVEHSWRFKRWARSVCKWHCWDYNAF